MSKFININKLKKHFKKGITPLLCALTVFNFVGINVNASEFLVYLPTVEPSIPQYGGYIVSRGLNTSNFETHYLDYFAFYPNFLSINGDIEYYGDQANKPSGASSSWFDYQLNTDISILFNDTKSVYSISLNDNQNGTTYATGYLVLYRIFFDGEVRVLARQYLNEETNFTFTYTTNWLNLEAIQFKGNFTSVYNTLTEYNTLSIVWSDDKKLVDLNTSIESILIDIRDSISVDGSSGSISDVSQSEINSVDSKEQVLVGSDVSTNDLNVSINPQASSVVWNLIDNAVSGNAKVFAMFISILTIGIIGLILNR